MNASLPEELDRLYATHGNNRYGLESISQLEHALQAATLAEEAGERPSMILAALLHDVGHMVGTLGENPAGEGIDNRHEIVGADWLAARLGGKVAEIVRLHVPAKRYLRATDESYLASLAPDSVLSLGLQGGTMRAEEIARFEALPFAQDAVRLRRFDDLAKDPNAITPPFAHFLRHLPGV